MDRLRLWRKSVTGPAYDAVTQDERLTTKASDDVHAHYQALQHSQRRLKRWITVLSLLLSLTILALLVAMSRSSWERESSRDLHSVVPPLPRSRVTFERNNTFAGPSSPEADQAWTAMMPSGDGFILLANDSRRIYDLPPGKSTAGGDVYDISVFHQLHCLAMIREHTLTLRAILGRDNWTELYDILLRRGEAHVYHCFDYIRQALMCAGDMTVEWPRTEKDGSRFAVDGWGITHECKSWDAVMEFMNEYTVANIY